MDGGYTARAAAWVSLRHVVRGKKPESGLRGLRSVHVDDPEQVTPWTGHGLLAARGCRGAGGGGALGMMEPHAGDGCTKWHRILHFETTGFVSCEFHLNEICTKDFEKENTFT